MAPADVSGWWRNLFTADATSALIVYDVADDATTVLPSTPPPLLVPSPIVEVRLILVFRAPLAQNDELQQYLI